MNKNRFKILKISLISLIILECIFYSLIYVKYIENINSYILYELYIAIISAFISGIIHFLVSLSLAIYAVFSRKIERHSKHVMYILPLISFYLPIPLAVSIAYIAANIKGWLI